MANISKRQRTEEAVILLYSQAKPIQDIAAATGLSEMEVVDIIAEEGKTAKSLRAIQIQAAIAHSGNATVQRLERLSSLRDSLQAEIESRGLKEVPIEKLISLYLKTEEAVERNIAQPTIYSSKAWDTTVDKEQI